MDAQHSPVDYTTLGAMLTSISAAGCPSLVRVGGPEDRPGIQQALDLGAFGVMVPTVRTVEDVRRAVDAAFFPPLGSRSIAWPIRWVGERAEDGVLAGEGGQLPGLAAFLAFACSGSQAGVAGAGGARSSARRMNMPNTTPHGASCGHAYSSLSPSVLEHLRERVLSTRLGCICRPQLGRDVASFLKQANDEVLLLIQIETKESYEDVEKVCMAVGSWAGAA